MYITNLPSDSGKNKLYKMKEIIAKMIYVVLTALLIPVILIGFIPYALFKGITSETVWQKYLDIWELFTSFPLYPYYKYMERKNNYEDLKRQRDYYEKECSRLNDVIKELEKEK